MKRTPLFQPFITNLEMRLVKKALKSGNLSRGPFVESFEQKFAEFVGCRFAIAVSSGTAGLDICLKALGIAQNDEIITSAYSFVASANCILYQKAKPVFCDINPTNGLINTRNIKKQLSNKTKAILPVDIFGQKCDLSTIRKFGLPIIVDACESFGAPILPGALAHVYGFYPNKQITTGEGGMIVTDDEDFATKLRSLRNQGFKKSKDYLNEIDIGYNFRMSDINAALGVAQLQNTKRILNKRRKAAFFYAKALCKTNEVQPVLDERDCNISIFNYPIICKSVAVRDSIIKEFTKNNIEHSLGFPPLLDFKYIEMLADAKSSDFPNTKKFAQRLLCLPIFTSISKRQIKRIVRSIEQGIKNAQD